MTEEKLFELWQSHLEKLRIEKAQYINPNNTTKGRGRLELGFDKQLPMESLPINVLIFNQSNLNDIRIYPGNAKVFHDFNPDSPARPFVWAGAAAGGASSAGDAADGALARRQGLASAFGARFDMETDAAFTLVLSALVWQAGQAGAWVLASGLMRYAFVGAAIALPWLAGPLPPPEPSTTLPAHSNRSTPKRSVSSVAPSTSTPPPNSSSTSNRIN